MKIKSFIFALIAIAAFSFDTTAQTTKKKVVQRQVNQTARIQQGVHSGELTKGEAARLKQQQRNINQTKRAAKADGVVTPKERAIIKHKQTKASANIAHKKNNNKSK